MGMEANLFSCCCSSYYLLLEGSQPEYMAGTGGRHALFISFTKTSSKTDGPCISRTRTVIMGLENVGSFQLTPQIRNGGFDGWVLLPHDVHVMPALQSAVSPAGRLNQVSWLLLAPAGWSPVHFPFRYTVCLWHASFSSIRFDSICCTLVWLGPFSNEIQYIDPACTSIAYCGAS